MSDRRQQVSTADVARQAIDRLDGQVRAARTLLEDLRKSYPNPAPYGGVATTVERLAVILDGDQ